jgi:hypothetical protein
MRTRGAIVEYLLQTLEILAEKYYIKLQILTFVRTSKKCHIITCANPKFGITAHRMKGQCVTWFV